MPFVATPKSGLSALVDIDGVHSYPAFILGWHIDDQYVEVVDVVTFTVFLNGRLAWPTKVKPSRIISTAGTWRTIVSQIPTCDCHPGLTWGQISSLVAEQLEIASRA